MRRARQLAAQRDGAAESEDTPPLRMSPYPVDVASPSKSESPTSSRVASPVRCAVAPSQGAEDDLAEWERLELERLEREQVETPLPSRRLPFEQLPLDLTWPEMCTATAAAFEAASTPAAQQQLMRRLEIASSIWLDETPVKPKNDLTWPDIAQQSLRDRQPTPPDGTRGPRSVRATPSAERRMQDEEPSPEGDYRMRAAPTPMPPRPAQTELQAPQVDVVMRGAPTPMRRVRSDEHDLEERNGFRLRGSTTMPRPVRLPPVGVDGTGPRIGGVYGAVDDQELADYEKRLQELLEHPASLRRLRHQGQFMGHSNRVAGAVLMPDGSLSVPGVRAADVRIRGACARADDGADDTHQEPRDAQPVNEGQRTKSRRSVTFDTPRAPSALGEYDESHDAAEASPARGRPSQRSDSTGDDGDDVQGAVGVIDRSWANCALAMQQL